VLFFISHAVSADLIRDQTHSSVACSIARAFTAGLARKCDSGWHSFLAPVRYECCRSYDLLNIQAQACYSAAPPTPQRSDFMLAVLIYQCLHGLAPTYLPGELQLASNHEARQRLRSAVSSSLIVRCMLLATAGDRVGLFLVVAAVYTCNSLPVSQHAASASSLSVFRPLLIRCH